MKSSIIGYCFLSKPDVLVAKEREIVLMSKDITWMSKGMAAMKPQKIAMKPQKIAMKHEITYKYREIADKDRKIAWLNQREVAGGSVAASFMNGRFFCGYIAANFSWSPPKVGSFTNLDSFSLSILLSFLLGLITLIKNG
jgi:hypothetical protein